MNYVKLLYDITEQ